MYSWSLHNVDGVKGNEHSLGFPFNQYFSFFVMSIVGVICTLILLFIKEESNYGTLNEENHSINSDGHQSRT